MIHTFLKAKHWQLFLIIFAIPMFMHIVMMNIMVSDISAQVSGVSEAEIDPMLMMETMMGYATNFMKVFSIVMLFIILTMFGWYWAICIGLQNKVPEHAKMNVKKFKFFYFFSVIYSLFLVGAMVFLAAYLPMIIAGAVSFSTISWVMSIFSIVNLVAVFAMFYCLYFAAKTIKTVELQRETTFGDFVGEFFLIWFFPIGVWFLQPKINALATQEFSKEEDMDWLNDL